MRALVGNKAAYRLRLDDREINRAVAELLQKETMDANNRGRGITLEEAS